MFCGWTGVPKSLGSLMIILHTYKTCSEVPNNLNWYNTVQYSLRYRIYRKFTYYSIWETYINIKFPLHKIFWKCLGVLLTVKQSRNDFFKPKFHPKTNSTLLLWYLRSTCFHSLKLKTPQRHFEIIWPLTKTCFCLQLYGM